MSFYKILAKWRERLRRDSTMDCRSDVQLSVWGGLLDLSVLFHTALCR